MTAWKYRVQLSFVLYCIFIVAVLLVADLGLMPNISALLQGYSGLDKVGHFILVGILAWLLNSAFRLGQLKLGRLRIFVGTIVVVTVVTLEEVAQLWIHTRRFELIDLLAGYLGIATAEIALRRQLFFVRDFFMTKWNSPSTSVDSRSS
jgi:VanZ family protein